MKLDRGALLTDRSVTGAEWCAAHTALVDAWLAALFDAASPPTSGVAVVAIGGYGRSELCAGSDIDVMLLHDKRVDVRAVADRLWYPIWDEGLKLGHSVCTPREALALAADDLDTATALLTTRLVAGDPRLADELRDRAQEQWRSKPERWLRSLVGRVERRHEAAGDVAFRLEPDLKDGRGGMRDVHTLHWAERAQRVLFHDDDRELDRAYNTLLDARVELHRVTGRAGNVLSLQDQPAVATALGLESADLLMAGIAEAARVIAWTIDDAWRRVRKGREIGLDAGARHGDPDEVLRLAITAAADGAAIERTTLQRLAVEAITPAAPWPARTRELFVGLLLTGRAAIPVIEALDQHGIWERFAPEWPSVRARPQRNPYHRFTVDRHLLETVANAAAVTERVTRPDLLVLGALLHDLGKGQPGDHTLAGVVLADRVAERIGLDADDADTLASLVANHLLLSDVATRRDLDDPATTDLVATAVGSLDRLALLTALTEADARATGPSAWTDWRAELVHTLVARVTRQLGGEAPEPLTLAEFPTEAQLEKSTDGRQHIDVDGDAVTVTTEDRPGVFSRVAGVLALRGLDVLDASAYSSETGRALARFRVIDPFRDETPWDRIVDDIELALDGRLALHARLAERAVAHDQRHRSRLPAPPASVRFDNRASNDATVVDVEAPDRLGILYRITRAMADLDLDIRSAKVQTLGTHVVDAFYVRDHDGRKITDTLMLGEIERAILHGIAEADGRYSNK